ncbi:sugar isomerase domain-containing protein [Brachybacterium sp. p3-SID957]|uniref:sugar isomerase domain-containing protein n=1 Tax=Brachybacterium sp. p3-SID957 TaxID=2916049 RepID=UPI00223B6052|nr:sugar isomerase domain-containing protein [Brachybacterium sp. p3-SID957]MCT1775533.1 sugar isomerase domain-containing protein [Brachybacterium sp. p3-SID957]
MSQDTLQVEVYPTREAMGAAAAADVAAELRRRLDGAPDATVRMVFAAAPSQQDMLDGLVAEPGIDWSRVTAFHMDEYIGLDADAPQRFGRWLDAAIFDRVRFGAVHRIEPGDDPEAAARAYAELLAAAPIDIVCLGIGENGHIAFNDPPDADLQDPELVRVVELDERSRVQQVEDGLFPAVEAVPTHAITLTIPALLSGERLFCVVPGERKREAVRRTLTEPVGPQCPATVLRTHPACTLYLDEEAAPGDLEELPVTDVAALGAAYLDRVTGLLARIRDEEAPAVAAAARVLADQIAADRLVHVFGPGGHSNLAAQEVFFRAGGLMHVAAILDEGTLLSSGALRSMAMERTPGYGRVVIEDRGLGADDVLVLVNAYGINAALIDAALTARVRGVTLIGVSSHEHANGTAPDHPARHPSGHNLHELVDVAIDCKVPIGDAVMAIDGAAEKSGAVSTFANAYVLNWLVLATIEELVARGEDPPIWRSGNAPGGDEANGRFLDRFRGRVRSL